MKLSSPAFRENQPIPVKHTGEGADVSPALAWETVPPGTQELTLLCEDPDAPTPEPWVHWILYKIPASATGLPEAVPPDATLPAFLTVEGVDEPPPGELVLVLRRRPSLSALLRRPRPYTGRTTAIRVNN